MLVKEHKTNPNNQYSIWKIEETEAFFKTKMELFEDEKTWLATIPSSKRRLEWLASRYLLHKMSGRKIRGACLKDEFGKPFLENSHLEISISHTHEYAAVLAADIPCGIDIQKITARIQVIKHKFLNDNELNSISTLQSIHHLHILWGAKEAIFKAFGRKKISFKDDIKTELLEEINEKGTFKGSIHTDNTVYEYLLYYQFFKNLVIVTAFNKEL